MKKLLLTLAFSICIATCLFAQTSGTVYYPNSDGSPTNDSPTRVSKGSNTLYVLNDSMGMLFKQLWEQKEMNKSFKVPIIIMVDTFATIDEKKIAFKPSIVKK